MSGATEDDRPTPADRREQDTHGQIRYFKLLETAYNMAKNGYYARSVEAARLAVKHGGEVEFDD
jgi:hypothetical protein